MANRRPRLRFTKASIVFAVLAFGIVGLIYAYVLMTYGINRVEVIATLLGIPLTIATSLRSILSRWYGQRSRSAVGTPEQFEGARTALVEWALRDWRAEIEVRQLDDPAPLVVRWQLTDRPIADHTEHFTRRTPRSFLPGRGRRFSGRTDRIAEMVAEFRRLARRRLVIVGEPGMGKTTLAVLFLRHLLEDHLSSEPVPVMFTLSGWDPNAESYHEWLTYQLGEAYPGLRDQRYGPDAPRTLVTGRQILPILDGLDELPEPLRPAVISALNALTYADAFILTCRTEEYQAAVETPGGDVITAAAVIEPCALRPADAARYLRRVLPPEPSPNWRTLLGTLTADTNTPLARALSRPLDLWLLRKGYIDPRTDPDPLLALGQTATAGQIIYHLLDHATEAMITARTSDQGHPFRSRRAWKQADAQRWLSFLARHLEATETTDLAWWRLHEALPRGTARLTTALTGGLTPALAVALWARITVGSATGLAVGLGLDIGLAIGGLLWLCGPTAAASGLRPLARSQPRRRAGVRARDRARVPAHVGARVRTRERVSAGAVRVGRRSRRP